MSQKKILTVEVNKKVLVSGKVIEESNESELLEYLNKGYKIIDSCKGVIKEPFVEHLEEIAEVKSTHPSAFMVTEVLSQVGDEVVDNKINLLMSKDGTFKITFDGSGIINKINFSVGDMIRQGDVILLVSTFNEVETELFITNTTYVLEKSTVTL